MTIRIMTISFNCRYAKCRYVERRYAECHYAECHYSECRYTECRDYLNVMLSVIMVSVVAPF
jgi:hypothetical protein